MMKHGYDYDYDQIIAIRKVLVSMASLLSSLYTVSQFT